MGLGFSGMAAAIQMQRAGMVVDQVALPVWVGTPIGGRAGAPGHRAGLTQHVQPVLAGWQAQGCCSAAAAKACRIAQGCEASPSQLRRRSTS